ncbi:MAG TPA: TonB-dependent receptor, partial [Bryobacteraceae bacterium]|nr:TonB-dependent receptor [Bryobacteraceae bacterium]
MNNTLRRRSFALHFLFGLMALFCVTGAVAQENTGAILGTVTDVTGAVVPDAKVTVTGPTLPLGLETTTDADGNFHFPRVPIGLYTVNVAKTGFSTMRQANVDVRLGSQLSFNPKLEVGQTTQVVEVSDVGVLIDTTSSRTSTNISRSQFENLPQGRSFNSILQMAPGVRYEVKGGNAGVGGIQVDGASGSENAYIIDGVDVSDVRRGSLRPNSAIPLDFVQEVQIKSGGFEAEYGGATGGVINVATRSGSNAYHGLAFFEWTGDNLNARDRGWWQRGTPASTAEFIKPKEDDYSIFWPGGSISGPLVKDRLFFFASLAPQLQKTTRTIDYTAGPRSFEQKQTSWYTLGRLDYSPTSKLQLNSSYIWSPQKIDGYLTNRDPRLTPPSNDLSIQGGYQPAQSVSGSAVYTLSPTVILSARYGYRYLNDKLGNSGLTGNYGLSGDPYIIYRNSAVGLAGVPANLQQSTNFSNVSSTFGIEKDITTRNNLYLDGTWIAGKHTIKAGYQLNRLHNEVRDDFTNGNFLVYWNDTFARGSVQGERGQYGYYIWEDGVRHTGSVNSRNQGVFIQDTWRATPRLTLNLGVRLESEFLPPFLAEQNGVRIGNPVEFDWTEK